MYRLVGKGQKAEPLPTPAECKAAGKLSAKAAEEDKARARVPIAGCGALISLMQHLTPRHRPSCRHGKGGRTGGSRGKGGKLLRPPSRRRRQGGGQRGGHRRPRRGQKAAGRGEGPQQRERQPRSRQLQRCWTTGTRIRTTDRHQQESESDANKNHDVDVVFMAMRTNPRQPWLGGGSTMSLQSLRRRSRRCWQRHRCLGGCRRRQLFFLLRTPPLQLALILLLLLQKHLHAKSKTTLNCLDRRRPGRSGESPSLH